MFRESLLEDCSDRGDRRRWATLTSFTLQGAFACACVVLPLLYPEALPLMHANTPVLMPPPSGGPPSPPRTESARHANTPMVEREDALVIHTPPVIPKTVDMSSDKRAATGDVTNNPYIPGQLPGDGTERASTLITQLIDTPKMHPVIKAPVNPVRISPGVSQGLLITRIEPRYPQVAVISRVQGDVLLAATIGRDGRIENLHLVGGHPLLAQAALDAVKQWRYRPYMLGNETVEVETQITVRFRLNDAR